MLMRQIPTTLMFTTMSILKPLPLSHLVALRESIATTLPHNTILIIITTRTLLIMDISNNQILIIIVKNVNAKNAQRAKSVRSARNAINAQRNQPNAKNVKLKLQTQNHYHLKPQQPNRKIN